MDQTTEAGATTVATRLMECALAQTGEHFDASVLQRAKMCLLDFLSCAFEALPQPWSEQAAALAGPSHMGGAHIPSHTGGAHIIGRAGRYASGDAAFANAVAGHGLVREDMHAGSVTHLGVVVWPTVLALAETHRVSGRTLLVAAIVGYETGAQIGRAVITESLARLFRPTGLIGPFAAVAAGARIADLDVPTAVHAFGLAGNCCAGLNQWPHTGASDMYFHPGFAVRNALTCLSLARQGATGSSSILEGEAGFFAAYARTPLQKEPTLFQGDRPEIMSVFNKAVPACNFAQSPCQAALIVAKQLAGRAVASIRVETTAAAVAYPGCNASGPFDRALQAKMSIAFGVAATLARGEVAEANYAALHDAEITRLMSATTLVADEAYTAAFPARQGARVTVVLDDGTRLSSALDDVVPADDALIRARFRAAACAVLGQSAASRIEDFVSELEHAPDAGELACLCALPDPSGDNTLGRTPS